MPTQPTNAPKPTAEQNASNWLDDFEATRDEFTQPKYSNPPQSISDQINDLPNSDKLTGFERWMYKKLPGFAESSVGKALQTFTEFEPAAAALKVMDVGAEAFERTLGLFAQWRDMAPDDEFVLKDAWAAGSLYWDTVRLPKFRMDENGSLRVQIEDGLPGAYAVTEARRLLEKGAKFEEVYDRYYGNLGALAIRAQMQDAFGHIVGDPLAWALTAVKPVQRLHAIRNLALTGKVDPNIVRGAIEVATAEGRLDDVAKMTAALAKAEESGKAITKFDRFAIALSGGTPYLDDVTKEVSGARKLFGKLNIFELTPQAKASELLDMVAANVGEHLVRPNWNADPEQFIKAVAGAARGSIGGEWGHLASTIQGRTVQGLLANSDATVKALGAEWKLYQGERTFLQRLSAALPGKDERALWNMAKTNPQLLMKQIVEAAKKPGNELLAQALQRGEISEKMVESIGLMDKSIPLLREEFYAKALVGIQDVAAKQAVLQFGIKEKGLLTKWTDALKAWESIPFIKANPANAVRNLVNNEITMASRGVHGLMSMDSIRNFWKGKHMPKQFQRGFSLSGDEVKAGDVAFDAGNAWKAIEDTLNGNAGIVDKVKDAAGNVDLKFMDFSKFSAAQETQASLRASTVGWMEFHQQYWNAKTGFTSISKSLDPAALDEMEAILPGISRTLDEVAASSGADSEKFAQLLQENIETNFSTILKNTEDGLGYKVQDVFGAETLNRIESGMPDAIKNNRVQEFVDGLRSEMEAHVDDLFNKHVENLPGIVAAQVQAGGHMQFNRIFSKAVDEMWAGNAEHAIRMSSINDALRYARETGDYKRVSAMWRKIMADSESHFGRVWKKFDAYRGGLEQGAKNAGIPFPKEVGSSFDEMRDGWQKFFEFRNKAYSEAIEGQGGKNFDQVQKTVDSMYNNLVGKEDELYQRIDDLMVKSLPDEIMGGMYRNFRDQVAQLRQSDRAHTQKFYAEVRRVDSSEAPALWQKYWADKQRRVEQIRQLEMRGSAAVQGDAKSIEQFMQQAPTGQEPQNVFELANRYNIASTTKAGKRNDRRVLNTVNKYIDKTNVTDTQIVQNAKLPDDVKSSYAALADAKKALKEAQGQNLPDLDEQKRLVDAARDGVKNAQKAYDDALTTNKIDGGMVDKLVSKRQFMDAETLPMDVAKQAFDARAAEKAQPIKQAAERAFIPDAEKMFPDPFPLETGLSELNYGRGYAAMDALTEEAIAQAQKSQRLVKDLPEHLQKKVANWSKQVNNEMSTFRSAGVQYAAFRRDSALLNYNRRTKVDNWIGHMAPFAFWTTHSVFNWAIHSLDRPAMLASYFRSREFFATAGLPDQNVPSRLKGHIRVNLPFAPDWMGDTFINPTRFMLPFDGFMMPWEQASQSKFKNEAKAKSTLEDMLSKGVITDEQFEEAVESQSGDAWDLAMSKVEEGGDSYDAMDFVSMTMTPHAPLMWALNAAKGTPNEIGAFTPMTRTVKNLATMMGVEDWQNSPYNIEGRIRKQMGLPAYDKWDDYRIQRQISNMAADGGHDMEKVKEAMTVAALVESGKMTPDDAKKQSDLFKEATKRANIEAMGGNFGAITSILGIPIKSYPTGEQAQRELGEQFSAAIQANEKGDPDALFDFFEENPEYEARLALFKSPEERLKNFMVDNLWARWNELPEVNQKEMAEQLGDNFQSMFLEKETRSYETITPEQLQIWLALTKGKQVGRLSAETEALVEFNQIKLTDPETAWRVETFYDSRKQNFPDFSTMQNKYYSLNEEGKKKYLKQNPGLKEYWDFRRQWMTKNPDLVRFLTDDEKQLKKFEKMRRDPEVAVPTAQEIKANFSPAMTQLLGQWTEGQTLPPSLDRYMGQLASEYGLTQEQLSRILVSP